MLLNILLASEQQPHKSRMKMKICLFSLKYASGIDTWLLRASRHARFQ
jgi:hypothetical protein